MMVVSMDKSVTLMQDVGSNRTAVWTIKYKELEKELQGVQEIQVTYCFGQMKRRVNQLIKLGYSMKETIFFNDEALHSRIKQVWSR